MSGLARFPPGQELEFHAADAPASTPVRLGRLLQGTMEGIDAAKVSIDPPVRVDDFLPGIGPLRTPRAVGGADLQQPVQFYGARSRYQAGFITDVAATFPRDGLRGAFLVAMHCRDGDSGAVCCDLSGAVLGLYVGSLRGDRSIQVFCPITAVLDALDCTL
ncbi:MAG TPA: hypothetical protein VFQ45_08070 [Longimicrobium sp.]|nr:hypothetical protein [Longimicrobium sp.]